jgi:hypothetical protein
MSAFSQLRHCSVDLFSYIQLIARCVFKTKIYSWKIYLPVHKCGSHLVPAETRAEKTKQKMTTLLMMTMMIITTTKKKMKNLLFTSPSIILACHLASELAQGHCRDSRCRDAEVASLRQGNSGICLLASRTSDLHRHILTIFVEEEEKQRMFGSAALRIPYRLSAIFNLTDFHCQQLLSH